MTIRRVCTKLIDLKLKNNDRFERKIFKQSNKCLMYNNDTKKYTTSSSTKHDFDEIFKFKDTNMSNWIVEVNYLLIELLNLINHNLLNMNFNYFRIKFIIYAVNTKQCL